ncbi:MAG: hypothetical protein P8184_05420 [Calditrichia bacterium]
MKKSKILVLDALVDFILGIALFLFPGQVIRVLGLPVTDQLFYPSILGGVLFGIGIALLIEFLKTSDHLTGLGLAGALIINFCGGLVLAGWLIWGKLMIPAGGRFLLWILVFILVIISGVELLATLQIRKRQISGR